MGAPEGNTNRMTHGGRSRPDLVLVGIRKRWPDIACDVRRYARRLRSLVEQQHGAVSHAMLERINEAARWEAVARSCMRMAGHDDTTPEKTVDYMYKAAQATQSRRACVAHLKIDGDDGSEPATAGDDATGIYAPMGDDAEDSQDAHTDDAAGDLYSDAPKEASPQQAAQSQEGTT